MRFDKSDVFHLHPIEEDEVYYVVPGTRDGKDVRILTLEQDMRRLQRVISSAHDHMMNGNPFKAFRILDSMMDLMNDTCA
jgi:hypothetical protein